MRILSIDFDYFQKVNKETLMLYPDGIDNSTALSEIIWAGHYATNAEELMKVRIDEGELYHLIHIIYQQRGSIPVRIAQSHKGIYSFIHDIYDFAENMRIVNIDMHHDMSNDNDFLDCGNWLKHVLTEVKDAGLDYQFDWIANEVSDEVYGFNEEIRSRVKTSIKSIADEVFDAIFLCRSDMWLPPHLDPFFTPLCDNIIEHFNNVEIESKILQPRRYYQEATKSIKMMIDNIQKEKHQETA